MTETASNSKKIIFSGMQPSGFPSLGNYLGALKNWNVLQEEYSCLYCIVDMHAITVRQDASQLRKNARNLLALYIALGLDPEKNIIYMQSHVPGHAELGWILNCYTYMGELNRMTQFKDKIKKHEDNINAGLFTYPTLMAADILLFNTDLVPVGEDQRQHLELCRDIAVRFNNIYGDVFKVPEAYIPKVGARIMSLQEPEKKMSKSETENLNNVIFMLDEPNIIMKKVKSAMTDSDSVVAFKDDKPGISNLMTIYATITGKSISEIEAEFENKGYGVFKTTVGEAVVSALEPIQAKHKDLIKNADYLDNVIKTNAERANIMSQKILRKVKKKVGFV